jgi:hypothetical protein
MASVTTNYGFDVPTSSDLVKNGATQIALLGQDLDTFLFRPFSRNGVINSGYDVWQRGTSIAINTINTYTSDRWTTKFTALSPYTVSRAVTGDTTNLPFIQYCARVQRASGQTGTGVLGLYQNFENINSIAYAGKQVTFSFYARAGANYSAASSALTANVFTGTGANQNITTGSLTGQANPINQTATLTTTWQRFSYTATLAATATQVVLGFECTPAGTAGAADYFEVTGVMLEVGNQASPYAPATPTYATELVACQRYYWRIGNQTGANTNSAAGWGVAYSTTKTETVVTYPVVMRVAPISVDVSNMRISDGVAAPTVSAITIGANSSTTAAILDCTSSGLTQYRPYYLLGNTGFLGFNAEL